MQKFFSNIAARTAIWMGQPSAFVGATLACVVWAVSGPLFNYSDTWQLVINTATTVLTFLAVFLIQNSRTATVPRSRPSSTNCSARSAMRGHTSSESSI